MRRLSALRLALKLAGIEWLRFDPQADVVSLRRGDRTADVGLGHVYYWRDHARPESDPAAVIELFEKASA